MKLLVAYSGDKAREIQDREAEVLNAWRNLQINMEYRKNILADTNDLFRFFNMVRDLMMWMDDMLRQMSNQEKPRWVKERFLYGLCSSLHSLESHLFKYNMYTVFCRN